MLAALRSAVRGKQGLLRALPTTGASRAFAAVERPFVPEEYENKYMVKTYNTDGVRGEPNLLFTHGKGQYLYDAQGACAALCLCVLLGGCTCMLLTVYVCI